MQVYLYCSYEGSQTGFFLTQLEGDGLAPVAMDTGVPSLVSEFFSYDCFHFLWRDLCTATEWPWQKPRCFGGFWGMRELRGEMSGGRRGTANLAFLAGTEELQAMRRAALTALGDYDAFRERLFSWLSVGGACGYELDGAALRGWLGQCGETGTMRLLVSRDDPAARVLPSVQSTEPPRTERDSLHLAACTCPWQEISGHMGGRWAWKKRPESALTAGEFAAAFTGRGPVWTLE